MMKKFEIIVAPDTRSIANKLHFAALECDLILVGESAMLVSDYCSHHQVTEVGKKVFANGTCENGQLIFPDETPGWKRDEIREFLADEALRLSVANVETLRRNADEGKAFLSFAAQDPNTTVRRF